MFRKLLIVFASGVVLSIVAFSAAWLVGGDKFRQEFHDKEGWSWNIGDDEDHGPRKTRSFAIEAGSQVAMELPVDLRFERGESREMTVEGPADVVDRLIWEGSRLSIKGSARRLRGLKVKIVAPEISGLDLEAPGDVTLEGMDQDQFKLTAKGAVDLDASGKVRAIFVDAAGAGDIDLARVEGEDATIRVNGAGDVTVAARRLVDIEINGVGDVTLRRKPQTLRSRINGIGSVNHEYDDDEPTVSETTHP